jgi:uncharacterized membrane protein YphA (DoxX/SURF4 family)
VQTWPLQLLRVIIPLCAATSFLLSHRLWTTERDYPHVPLFEGLPQPPQTVAVAMFVVVLLGLLLIAIGRFTRAALTTTLAIIATWVVLDQNRWQPYLILYTVTLACLLLATMRLSNPFVAMAPLRLLLCFTYFYSGLHKFNYRYLFFDFGAFVEPLFLNYGLTAPQRLFPAAALVSAVFEAGMGVMLLFARTRRVAVLGLTLMHAFILLAIGPFGANYNSVVWPWNLASLAAVWLLFHPRTSDAAPWLEGATRRIRVAFYGIVVLFGAMPLLSFPRMWESSLSFQLYCGKQPSASLDASPGNLWRLPPFAESLADKEGKVDLFEWAMREMNAVPNVERRVLLATARSVALQHGDRDLQFVYAEPPSLFSMRRDVHVYAFQERDARPVELTAFSDSTTPARRLAD